MSNPAVTVCIMYIFTWNTGPRFCLSINWCKQTGGGAVLHSTEKRTQVAHRHLLNERGPIFTKIPPLKYLWWEHTRKHMIRQVFFFPVAAISIFTQWFLNLFCHVNHCKQITHNLTRATFHKLPKNPKDTKLCGCNDDELESKISCHFEFHVFPVKNLFIFYIACHFTVCSLANLM